MKVQAQTLLGIIVVCDNDDTVATDTRGGEVDRRQLAILRIGLDGDYNYSCITDCIEDFDNEASMSY